MCLVSHLQYFCLYSCPNLNLGLNRFLYDLNLTIAYSSCFMYVWECLLLYVTEYNYSVLINIFFEVRISGWNYFPKLNYLKIFPCTWHLKISRGRVILGLPFACDVTFITRLGTIVLSPNTMCWRSVCVIERYMIGVYIDLYYMWLR